MTFGPTSLLFASSGVPGAVAFCFDVRGFELRFDEPVDERCFTIVGRGPAQLLLRGRAMR